MKKIKLPREITEAIEDLRVEGYTDTQIVYDVESGKGNRTLNDYFFDVGTPDDLMQALVNGYEVEKTPEEMVREFYESLNTSEVWEPKKRDGVEQTLNILGIKIGGINA